MATVVGPFSSCSAPPLRRAHDDDVEVFLMHQQQVPQCDRPYKGQFLDGILLLRLLSSRHAGSGGSDDDDDTVRRRRLCAPTRDGQY